MKPREILKKLRDDYSGILVFEIEKNENHIVAMLDNGTTENVVGIIETTEEEYNNFNEFYKKSLKYLI